MDNDGKILWPPASVPRPPETGPPGVSVWYVVGEDQAREGIAIGKVETQRRVDESETRSFSLVALGLFLTAVVVALALYYILVLAPR